MPLVRISRAMALIMSGSERGPWDPGAVQPF
jgi:hypothetical protein